MSLATIYDRYSDGRAFESVRDDFLAADREIRDFEELLSQSRESRAPEIGHRALQLFNTHFEPDEPIPFGNDPYHRLNKM